MVNPQYPGVYIQEVPSGARAIVGVPTAVAAFVGRAAQGQVDEPRVLNNWGDFERQLGGLWTLSAMSYAVQQFFANGGGRCVVVRCAPAAVAAQAAHSGMTLVASSPGRWGERYGLRVDHDVGPGGAGTFNLTVGRMDGANLVALERHVGVSVVEADATYLPRVLERASTLVRVGRDNQGAYVLGQARPAVTNNPVPLANGDDGAVPNQAQMEASMGALARADIFNILCIPPYLANGTARPAEVDMGIWDRAARFAADHRAVLLVDPPGAWAGATVSDANVGALAISAANRPNAALFFPRLRLGDPLRDNQTSDFVPSGAVAGVMARTDGERGVWKAAAGIEAGIGAVRSLTVPLTDAENGLLNPRGINCIRNLPPAGVVVWGGRTLAGDDRLASDWKYLSVRRLALYVEESLFRGLQWAVFEPNDETLWGQLRAAVGSFMKDLFQKGAFAGGQASEAFFVRCDASTTTPLDQSRGVVNVQVGFAPLRPAEFVIITLQQMAGQSAV